MVVFVPRGIYPSQQQIFTLPSEWEEKRIEPLAKSCVESVRQHGDLITNIGYLIFAAGRLIPNIPQSVSDWGYIATNLTGLLYVDFMVSFTWKTARDCIFCLQHKNWLTSLLTLTRTVNAVSDTCLLALGIVAAGAIGIERGDVATTIYTVTRPWGVTFLFIAIGLDIANYFAYRNIGLAVEQLNEEPEASERMRHILHSWQSFAALTPPSQWEHQDPLASNIRATMDKYSWKTVRELLANVDLNTLPSSRVQKGFHAILDNIETQRLTGRNTLLLTVINYAAPFVRKAFPYSTGEALFYLFASSLNTCNQCYKKKRQHDER